MAEDLTRHQKVARDLIAKNPNHYKDLARLSNTPNKRRPNNFALNPELARRAGLASAEARRKKRELADEASN